MSALSPAALAQGEIFEDDDEEEAALGAMMPPPPSRPAQKRVTGTADFIFRKISPGGRSKARKIDGY